MTAIISTQDTVPWFGRTWEHKHAAFAGVGSLFLCTLYYVGTRTFSPEFTPNTLEFTGTFASLWSVWITQKRNVLALPIGIVAVVFMGWFFYDIDLVGQFLLHWVYYVPVQAFAWYHWRQGGQDDTELIVTRVSNPQRAAYAASIIGFTVFFGAVLNAGWDDALYTYWDASIVAASVVAMVLMTQKKYESWWLWIGPVNVSAIILYYQTEAYMFSALYCLFLAMAFVGLDRWMNAQKLVIP
jgi:nicotinamide mononucleotide transporter